jgi:hypothetical protein
MADAEDSRERDHGEAIPDRDMSVAGVCRLSGVWREQRVSSSQEFDAASRGRSDDSAAGVATVSSFPAFAG